MTAQTYILGIACAILSGSLSYFGNVLEKKAVIDIPKEERDKKFGRKLLKNPVWLVGFILAMIIDPIFMMLANALLGTDLGPTLVPGLMTSGLIILAIGSAKIVGEKLGKHEITGIVLMILGVTFLGISNLESGDVDIIDLGFITRIGIFSTVVSFLMACSQLAIKRSKKEGVKGISLAISSGFAFSLSNLWLSILIATFDDVLSGKTFTGEANIAIFMVFLVALAILFTSNYFGLAHLQFCFKYADASKAIPIQQLPLQILPVFSYFLVFLRVSSFQSISLMLMGVFLILTSAFLLGKRQASFESL
ncbi:MAG: hypothetical protein ACFFCS_12065 [Candidatus Hodarchaeota archaeon]